MKRFLSYSAMRRQVLQTSSDGRGNGLEVRPQFRGRVVEEELRELHRAAREGDAYGVRLLLLLRRSKVNDRDEGNRTALHLACTNGHVEVVKLLIEQHCHIDAIDNVNMTLLMKATQYNHEECAAILLHHGADPNHMDENGNTALHYPAYNENLKIGKQLLLHNADIERINKVQFNQCIFKLFEIPLF